MLLKKLVVAEDDDAIFHLIQATVGDAGYLCLRARDGEQALTRVRAEMPDAIVLDRGMPVLDGIEVVKRLKADVILSRIPVLMLTAMATVEDRVAGLEAGADDYLPKPFHVRELAARIKALVRQSRRERHRNPTTGLPSGEAVDEHVDALLKKKTPIALCYCDIEGWEALTDALGYKRYEGTVRRLGRALLDAARSLGDPVPFVGHVGGDDFVVVCAPARADDFCAAAIDEFGTLVPEMDSEGRATDPLRLSISVLRTDETPVRDLDELSARLAQAKRAGKRATPSAPFRIR